MTIRSRCGGPGGLPGLFRAKLVFVVSLTAAAVAIHLTYAAIRRGCRSSAGRRVSSLLAVLLAAYMFS